MKIELELSKCETDLLVEVLSNYTDEGPAGEGWQSDELSRIAAIVWQAVAKSPTAPECKESGKERC